MNDYTLYLVKKAYYKKQLIKQAFMNKYALSEESAKNINPALLERFRVFEEAGKKYGGDGEGSIRDRLMARALKANGGDRTAANSAIVNSTYNLAGQHVPYLGPGSGLTAAETVADSRWRTDAIDKGEKKLLKRKGSKSRALVPYVDPVEAAADSKPSKPDRPLMSWGRYATVNGSSLAGGIAGYLGSTALSKYLGLKGGGSENDFLHKRLGIDPNSKYRKYGDIALRTLGTFGGATAAAVPVNALYKRYVK